MVHVVVHVVVLACLSCSLVTQTRADVSRENHLLQLGMPRCPPVFSCSLVHLLPQQTPWTACYQNDGRVTLLHTCRAWMSNTSREAGPPRDGGAADSTRASEAAVATSPSHSIYGQGVHLMSQCCLTIHLYRQHSSQPQVHNSLSLPTPVSWAVTWL